MRKLLIALCLISGLAWGGIGEFDGVDDYVYVSGNLPNQNADMTVIAWIKGSNKTVVSTLIQSPNGTGTGRGWLFCEATTGKLQSKFGAGVTTGTSDVLDGNLHQVCAVRLSGTTYLYVDGVLENSGAEVADSNVAGLLIGSGKSSNYFDGDIYRVQIFSRDLAALEVLALYNSNGNGFPNDEDTVVDYSGNGNDGNEVYNATLGKRGDDFYYDFDDVNTATIKIDSLASSVASDTKGSISAWFTLSPLPGAGEYTAIMSVGDANANEGVALYVAASDYTYPNNIVFRLEAGGVTDWIIVTTNWVASADTLYHIVAIQRDDGNNPEIWINSVEYDVIQKDTSPVLGSWFNDMTGLDTARIGARNSNSRGDDLFFDGEVSRLRYFPSALLSADVTNLYVAGTTGLNPLTNAVTADYTMTPLKATPTADWIGAVGYSDGQALTNGTRIIDISGNSLHGYATNGVKFATVQGVVEDSVVVDYSGNGNDGTNVGATISRTGADWAVAFNGGAERIVVENSTELKDTNSFSITMWTRVTADTAGAVLYRNNGFAASDVLMINYSDASDFLQWYVQDGTSVTLQMNTGASSVSLNTWYHLAVTYDSSVGKSYIYLDGIEKASDLSAGGAVKYDTDVGSWQLGGRDALAPSLFPYSGDIKEFQIYNEALTSNQVFNIASGTNPTNAPLVDYTMTPYSTPIPITKPRNRR